MDLVLLNNKPASSALQKLTNQDECCVWLLGLFYTELFLLLQPALGPYSEGKVRHLLTKTGCLEAALVSNSLQRHWDLDCSLIHTHLGRS